MACLPAFAYAQGPRDAYLVVSSNLPGSLVLADSTVLGPADAETVFRIKPGPHFISLTPAQVGWWGLNSPGTDIVAVAGDTSSITLDFPITYRIDSTPFGATVFREDEDSALGTTPLVFTSESVLRAALILELSGYATERIIPGTQVINQHSVSFRPLDEDLAGSQAVELESVSHAKHWLTYSALGLVAAGGALAVHFKFKADDKYEEYLATADPDIKDEVDRLDRMSYVALGGVQLGIGILVYRLAF